MKKINILGLILILVCLVYIVTAATVSHIVEDTTPDQTNTEGVGWNANHSLSNVTDGNYTTYIMTLVNDTYAMINFSKEDGSGIASKVQITYNTSSDSVTTNYTLSDYPICWSNDINKLLFRLGSNFTQNYSNKIYFENFTWLNGTGVTLANIRIDSIVVFNRTANLTILNESDSSNLVWTNSTNMSLDNDDLTGYLAIYNCSGAWDRELGSGNWTVYNTDGKIFATSNTTFADGTEVCINYSYWGIGLGGNVISSNNYTLDYLSGNITLASNLHNNTLMGANYTFLNDSTPKNKKECYNGTNWILLGTESDEDEIFDIRVFWSILGSNWTIDYNRVEPDQYTTYTSASIVFNITANITLSPDNQPTVNVSLWTKVDNASAPFTINLSSTVLLNTSYVNVTVNFQDGDRVWWYWSFTDNQSRIVENTSIRILDVLLDYQIMSIGDGINITMNTGDAFFNGDITANSFTGIINGLANMTQNWSIIRGGLNESWIVNSVGNWSFDKFNYWNNTETMDRFVNISWTNVTYDDEIVGHVGNWTKDKPQTVNDSHLETNLTLHNESMVKHDNSTNISMKSYVDAQDTFYNESMVIYVNDSIISHNASIKSYIDAQDALINTTANIESLVGPHTNRTDEDIKTVASIYNDTVRIDSVNDSLEKEITNRINNDTFFNESMVTRDSSTNDSQTIYTDAQDALINTTDNIKTLGFNITTEYEIYFVLISELSDRTQNGTILRSGLNDSFIKSFDSNASTACSSGEYLDGLGSCINLNDSIDRRTDSITYNASSINTIEGTLDGGSLTSIQNIDSEWYNVSEDAGGSPLLVEINFTDIVKFSNILIRTKYEGGLGHEIEIQTWNYDSSAWESHGDITDQSTMVELVVDVLDASDHISGGLVQLRFDHQQTGVATHDFLIDYVALQEGFTSITSSDHDGFLGRDDESTNHPWASDIRDSIDDNITASNESRDIHISDNYYNKTESDTSFNALSNLTPQDVNDSVGNHSQYLLTYPNIDTDSTDDVLVSYTNVTYDTELANGSLLWHFNNSWWYVQLVASGPFSNTNFSTLYDARNPYGTSNFTTDLGNSGPYTNADNHTQLVHEDIGVFTRNNGTLGNTTAEIWVAISNNTWDEEDVLIRTSITDNITAANDSIKIHVDNNYVKNTGDNLTGPYRFNDTVLINGTYESSTTIDLIQNQGDRTIFLFYPYKGAIVAGYFDDINLNPSQLGDASATFGYNNNVTAVGGTAFGSGNFVTGDYATTMGETNTISGGSSLAGGTNTDVSGYYSIGFGDDCDVSGWESACFGNANSVTGANSMIAGKSSVNQGSESTTVGDDNDINTGSLSSFIAGEDNFITGGADYSMLFGEDLATSGTNSFVVGEDINNTASNGIIMGSGVSTSSKLRLDVADTFGVGFNQVGPTFRVQKANVTINGTLELKPNTTGVICNTASEGGIYYDGADNRHYGCNGTDWRALY